MKTFPWITLWCLSSLLFLAAADRGLNTALDSPVHWAVPWPDPARPVQGYPILQEARHYLVYRATPQTGLYSHHAQIARHAGMFFVTWSSHRDGEDGPGQRILLASSRDGARWSAPRECFPSFGPVRAPGDGGRVLTANGLLTVDGVLYAIAEVDDKPGAIWPKDSSELPKEPTHGRIGWGRVARALDPSGKLGPIFWLVDEPPEPAEGAARYPSAQDPRFRRLARSLNQLLADPLHMPAWDFFRHTAWTTGADGHLLCEPTVYQRPDGVLVKLSRDRNRKDRSYRLYAALSRDGGKTWGAAVRTDIPDSPSKSTAGQLPDGRIYLIGNQVARGPQWHGRDPLVLSLSRDGKTFDWAAAIRHGAPEVRFPGKAKTPGFQYPSAIVAGNALWVVYSIGKEDVAVTSIPLSALPPLKAARYERDRIDRGE